MGGGLCYEPGQLFTLNKNPVPISFSTYVYHWCDSCSRHVISFSAAKYTGHMVWLIDLSDIRYVLMEYECDIEISIDNDFFLYLNTHLSSR